MKVSSRPVWPSNRDFNIPVYFSGIIDPYSYWVIDNLGYAAKRKIIVLLESIINYCNIRVVSYDHIQNRRMCGSVVAGVGEKGHQGHDRRLNFKNCGIKNRYFKKLFKTCSGGGDFAPSPTSMLKIVFKSPNTYQFCL